MGETQKMNGVGRKLRLKFGMMVALVVLSVSVFASSASAQVAVPIIAELEASVSDITLTPGDPDFQGTVVVGGVTVKILNSAVITTPGIGPGALITTDLVPLSLEIIRNGINADGTTPTDGRLPGRPNGFIGGTLIAVGLVKPVLGSPTNEVVIEIEDAFFEPAENVIAATVTEHNCGTSDCSNDGSGSGSADTLRVGGVEIRPNTDPRLPAAAPSFEGLPIDLNGSYLAPGDDADGTAHHLAGVEGYNGMDGVFYYHVLEVEGAQGFTGLTNISVTRALARNRTDPTRCQYRVQGSVQNPTEGTVVVSLLNNSDLVIGALDPATAIDDPEAPGIGSWSIRQVVNAPCAPKGRADFTGTPSGTATTTFDFAVR